MRKRRLFLGLLAGLLTFYVSMMLQRSRKERIVPSTSSVGWTSPDGKTVVYQHELLPEPAGATEHFNSQLRNAISYQEWAPCFDQNGRRIGERAIMLLAPPQVLKMTWRIVWTQQAEDHSESFTIESASLADARYFETLEPADWKKCGSGR
jgi:hypothetical protein